MNTSVITLTALLLSLICLLYLRNSDAKRRRVFGIRPWDKKRYAASVWSLCLSPAIVLLYLEQYSAFIMWLAALSLLGWLIAWFKPRQTAVKG